MVTEFGIKPLSRICGSASIAFFDQNGLHRVVVGEAPSRAGIAIYGINGEPHDNPTFESTFEIERKIGTWANVFVEYAANYPRHARPTDLL